jgi:hypothetical protein
MMMKRLRATPVAWMIGICLLSCGAVIVVGGSAIVPELLFGMAAPLASAIVTWLVMARTQASAPERLTNVLISAFGIKMVLFGAYVVVMLGVLSMRPVPFIASFTSYYVALHLGEALLLKRLVAAGGRPGGLLETNRLA